MVSKSPSALAKYADLTYAVGAILKTDDEDDSSDEETRPTPRPQVRTIGVETDVDPLDTDLEVILLNDLAQSQVSEKMAKDQMAWLKKELCKKTEEIMELQAQNRQQYVTCVRLESERDSLQQTCISMTADLAALKHKTSQVTTGPDTSELTVWLKDLVTSQNNSAQRDRRYEQSLEAMENRMASMMVGLREKERKAHAKSQRLSSELRIVRAEYESRLEGMECLVMQREEMLMAMADGRATIPDSSRLSQRDSSRGFSLATHRGGYGGDSSRTARFSHRDSSRDRESDSTPPSTSRSGIGLGALFDVKELKCELRTPEDAYITMLAKRSPFATVYMAMYNELRGAIKLYKESVDQFLTVLWAGLADKSKSKTKQMEQANHQMRMHQSKSKTNALDIIRKVNNHIKAIIAQEKAVKEVWKRERTRATDINVQADLPHPEVSNLTTKIEYLTKEHKKQRDQIEKEKNSCEMQIDHLQQTLHLAVRAVMALHKALHEVLHNVQKHKAKWTRGYTDPIKVFQLTRATPNRIKTPDSVFREFFGEILKLDIDNLHTFGSFIMGMEIGPDRHSASPRKAKLIQQEKDKDAASSCESGVDDYNADEVASRLSAMLDQSSQSGSVGPGTARSRTSVVPIEEEDSGLKLHITEDDVGVTEPAEQPITPPPEEPVPKKRVRGKKSGTPTPKAVLAVAARKGTHGKRMRMMVNKLTVKGK
eukprot:TRINITY_DN53994_c0_g1_i1.p1 TRINITY_DN53994_c0_g1~~TRINITY_DN53994_c0_g1_i1.p1  ORF type:complete len:710 (-),score=73.14 TRINITY_DN53994_c0_g1_i1:134-2263(-)